MVLPREVDEITRAFLGLADGQAPGLVCGLYLRGSLGFGEYFPGRSDIDFTAVLSGRPDAAQLNALAAAHAQVRDAYPAPYFDGFHVVAADLAKPPAQCPDIIPCMFQGRFHVAGRFDMNPVSWHELARHAITVRGPELSGGAVWTDDAALRAYSHGNLSSYWAGIGARR